MLIYQYSNNQLVIEYNKDNIKLFIMMDLYQEIDILLKIMIHFQETK
jgi:hypothetical protein